MLKKNLFQSNELLHNEILNSLKGGTGNTPPPIVIISSIDGGETDKRNKRPGVGSSSSIGVVLASI
jgi:hypothetical protein